MATVPAVKPARPFLHVRGSWPAREDRIPSAVWLGILWAGMIAGFGTDFHRFAAQAPPPPKVLWVHAFVFSLWMFIVTAQVLLVLRDRVSWHRKFGWFAVAWAGLMAIFGPWAGIASQVYALRLGEADPQFLALNLVDLGGFLALLVWGVALRKNPAAHRRMMILSTISLADPGFGRLIEKFVPEPASPTLWFLYAFYGNILLIVLMTAWDLYRRRLMRSFVLGAAALLAAEYVCAMLYFWGPWATVTTKFIQACVHMPM